ncbi:peroxiredoxin family protein [Nocardia sp. NPDC127579]|uniref:peroxiredoxin family protein n=1 Tax=Nocardia sp. NPDC127579 TaxID=3345402 RepID=UPI00363BA9DE
MLTSGTRLPRIELEDTAGRPWERAGSVLLYFMRSTSCPLCNRHVRDLVARRDHFAGSGIDIAVVVPEDRATAVAWKAERGIPFPVLVGPAGSPHESIGLTRKMFGSMQQSGTVLVGPDGVVRHAHGATLPAAAYDRKGIDAAVEALVDAA